ncbi:flavodoxin domain-containing protein [Aestuariibacter halophilus]|uniref:Flavodoxin domain-containing protein n=1 Tax=Fluctibacter halophilus TaxID=226011 RepID=A0ABS8GCD8_9ALTE|nr:flavodoxin domain-containing protein [Aestuariibacter halophilus]MCC2618158.1 flavodoxin domain-containing protein [Aestuariibacter halophilus]
MASFGLFVGSVYGNAEHVADECRTVLEKHGHSATVYMDPSISDFEKADAVLMISSTTGQGDIPPNLEFFIMDLRDKLPLMNGKPFAVVGLGDSSYGDTFCGAGKQIFEVMLECQGKPVADLFIVDAMETLEPEAEVLPWLEQQLPKFES